MIRRILIAAVALAAAAPAFATLGPPVRITREDGADFGRPGREFRGSFLVETRAPLEIELIELSGEGWEATLIEGPPSLSMGHDDAASVAYRATPAADAGSLYLYYSVEGRLFRKNLDPGPGRSRRLLEPPVAIAEPAAARVGKSASVEYPGLEPLSPPARKARPAHLKTVTDETADLAGAAKTDKSRTITVSGRVVFLQPAWDLTSTTTIPAATVGARGATVSVWDEDSTWDEFLGDDLTDEEGYFSITFTWDPCFTCDSTPDLYVNVRSGNTRIVIESEWLEIDYNFDTATWNDYTGSNLDVGWIRYADEEPQATLFMVSHMTRAFQMIQSVSAREQPYVEVQYPGEGAFYATLFEEIHIDYERRFNSGTVVHEYGHHFIENFGDTGSTDTCNDVCDDSGWIEGLVGSCGHCRWCPESQGVAWSEGWPQWLADYYARWHQTTYGAWPPTPRFFETTGTCQETGVVEAFKRTEGRVAALIRDIEDGNNENDPLDPDYADVLSEGGARVFAVTDLDEPTNALEYFLRYRARYSPPEPELWETTRNVGYPNYDVTPPAPPGGFQSQTHDIGVPTSARRIYLDWDASVDDISQVERYVYNFTFDAPGAPDTTTLGVNALFGQSPQLSPGTYYANIMAQDRAGNWSDPLSIGPFIVTEPPDPDVAFYTPPGWDEPVIPSSLTTLSDGNVPAPLFLVGNGPSTYWNAAVQSLGPTGVPGGTDLKVFVDGQPLPWVLPPAVSIDEVELTAFNEAPQKVFNVGPISVPGGRHTFVVRGDAYGEVAESDEDNNAAGRSWVWSPAPLTEGVDAWRGTPPSIVGGWDDITSGGNYFNGDGLRFASTGWWNAVTLVPDQEASNFDLRLYQPSTGATDGFTTPLAWSPRGDGRTDAVLVNRNWTGEQDWDVAVWAGTEPPDPGSYRARHVTSTSFTYGDSIGVSMGTGEMMTLHEVYVQPGNVGTAEILVSTDPAQGRLWAAWFDAGFQYGDILDETDRSFTDEDGFCRLQVDAPAANYYCVAIYRDATDGNGTAPETFSLQIGAPSPDIVATAPTGWDRPLIPWEDTDDLDGPIPTPTSLPGFEETWIHTATVNASPTATAGAYVQTVGIDDRVLTSPTLPFGYAASDSFKAATATVVDGGRHTVWMRAEWPGWEDVDPFADNNHWAEQWVWSPHPLTVDVPFSVGAPPDPTGGWDRFLNASQPAPDLHFNCIGVRTPVFQAVGGTGHWAAMAVTPVDSVTDVDLRLHDQLSTGAASGFTDPVLTSAAGGVGATEFLVVNPAQAGVPQFDLGLIEGQQAAPGATGAKVMTTVSNYLGTDGVTPAGGFGPFGLPAGRPIALFEIWLDAGFHQVTLVNGAGGADLGLSLHGGAATFARASDDSSSATAWLEPAGADETASILVETAGYHALAVWKAGWNDLETSVQFSLDFASGGASDTPSSLPGPVTRIESVQPNPFNPQTTVAFSVERSGPVSVEIYDLRGLKVRTLHQGDLRRGRHQRVWDGRDDGGRLSATGTYLVRLRTSSAVDHRKVLLLK